MAEQPDDAICAQRNEKDSQMDEQLKPVAIKVDRPLTDEQYRQLRDAWKACRENGDLPILCPGIELVWPQPDVLEWLDRIERKLDTLITALADEEQEEPTARTLDGEEAGSERDTSQPL